MFLYFESESELVETLLEYTKSISYDREGTYLFHREDIEGLVGMLKDISIEVDPDKRERIMEDHIRDTLL